MNLELVNELISVAKEVSALKVVVVKLGMAVDQLSADQDTLIRADATNETHISVLLHDRDMLQDLLREAGRDIKKLDVRVARISDKLGLDKSEVIHVGNKVEITGSELKDAQVGMGGQRKSGEGNSKYIIWGAVVIAVLVLAWLLGIRISTEWFSLDPGG